MIKDRKILDEIGIKYHTDKSSEVHNYCDKYEKYIPFERDEKIKILEIGVLGGASLNMWKDYFYNADIIGIDINDECKKYESERIKIEIGNQTDEKFIKNVINKYKSFDMILDDGSHINSDVISSFEMLFSSLNVDGIYIIEDSVTSYWPDFGGGDNDKTTINYFKKLVDDVNYRGLIVNGTFYRNDEPLIIEAKKEIPDCRTDIESIIFLNSIIIIRKR